MKATEEQKLKFSLQFTACINQLVRTLTKAREGNIEVLNNWDFKHEHDFEDIAKEIFLEEIEKFHHELYGPEAAVQGAKSILHHASKKDR